MRGLGSGEGSAPIEHETMPPMRMWSQRRGRRRDRARARAGHAMRHPRGMPPACLDCARRLLRTTTLPSSLESSSSSVVAGDAWTRALQNRSHSLSDAHEGPNPSRDQQSMDSPTAPNHPNHATATCCCRGVVNHIAPETLAGQPRRLASILRSITHTCSSSSDRRMEPEQRAQGQALLAAAKAMLGQGQRAGAFD